MTGGNVVFLVIVYALFWVGLMAYVGWIAFRLRGVRTELEAVRAIVEERDESKQGRTGN